MTGMDSQGQCQSERNPLLVYMYSGTDKKVLRARECIRGEIEEWRRNPTSARGPEKRIMRYLNRLIKQADSMFRLGTVESVQEALLWYLLAAEIMGPHPNRPFNGKAAANPWTKVGDRLTKIRSRCTIDGKKTMMPLFDPPINPALLMGVYSPCIDVVDMGIDPPLAQQSVPEDDSSSRNRF